MAELTRDAIFAESERRWPDFENHEHHGKSLGFETGAQWIAELPIEERFTADASRMAIEAFPTEEGDDVVGAWRRAGFRLGVVWAREKLGSEQAQPDGTAEDAMRRRFIVAAGSPPATDGQRDTVKVFQEAAVAFATKIEQLVPEGRDKALALTHLEDALMRANRAVFTAGQVD